MTLRWMRAKNYLKPYVKAQKTAPPGAITVRFDAEVVLIGDNHFGKKLEMIVFQRVG